MTEDRYNTSKLLEVLLVRQLASEMAPNDPVIINALTPGLCRTTFFRHAPGLLRAILEIGVRLVGRTAEVGSRCLMAAAAAGRESHGGYMENCKLKGPGPFIESEEGAQLQKRVYDELLQVLEDVQPGITKNIRG